MTIKISCPCCNSNQGKIKYSNLVSIYSQQPWDLIECRQCRNIITNPVPDKKILDDCYSQTYLYDVHLLGLEEKKFRARQISHFINKILTPGKDKKILEAGCMYGSLLMLLKNDYTVKGIELEKKAVDYCKENGLNVIAISIEDYLEKSDENFDLIILSHVFEHLLSPNKVLESLERMLNANGKILISVPNSDSFCRKIFGRYWGWWQVPIHVNHFRESSIRELAIRKNLIVEESRFKGGDSLMLLLNFVNLFRFKNENKGTSKLQKLVIRFFTSVFRYWYLLGNEELTMVLKKK
jgi:2-polyprenyl-3-methyl-5-hydroxy-6-metoxy-1,4-benzoquinol methylase